MIYIVSFAKRSFHISKWNCKYHIVFAPKYRRKVFYEEKRLEAGSMLRELCNWKGVHIIAAEVCPDHVHMFLEIPPKMSVVGSNPASATTKNLAGTLLARFSFCLL